MRQIKASEAKAQLYRLVRDVERGETIVITRHGRAVARVVPEAWRRRDEIRGAISRIVGLRRQTGHSTTREILSARDEGREA